LACLFSLQNLITALIVTQTLLQFAAQCVAVIVLRQQKREPVDSYRMPLYPLPALVALIGWVYVAVTSGVHYLAFGGVILAIGIAGFLLRARASEEWPFVQARQHAS
jgi:amino acid transporter